MRAHRRYRLLAQVVLCVALLGGGWRPTDGQAASPCDLSLPISDEQASRILAEERPFAPANRDLYFTFEHPDWADSTPPEVIDGPGLSEAETRTALRAFLELRFPCDLGRVQEGLAVYGDPVAREKFPDPTLRAALAALTGTLGEPTIEFLLYRTPVTLVNFGIYVEAGWPSRIAGNYASPDGTREIVFDRLYRFAPFGAFSALLVHEALHAGADPAADGLPEESVASSVEALVYMQMLLTDPSLARLPDELTRIYNNHLAVVRLNSGPLGTDRLTLFVLGSAINIDPLAVEPLTEFHEFYARYGAPNDPGFRERETEGNWLLQAILERLAEPGETPPTDADFDVNTLAFVDQNQSILSPAELVVVACILELDVSCDEAADGATQWTAAA